LIVKICGIVDPDNAALVARSGADWIGINFWPRSKRWVNRERGRAVADAARAANPEIRLVGVFRDQLATGVIDLARELELDFAQLHGDESAETCARVAAAVAVIRGIGLRDAADLDRVSAASGCAYLLVDAPLPGSGEVADWSLARRAVDRGGPVVLAGGLRPDNVADAVRAVRPAGVDVASGVEASPGIKDIDNVRRFVDAAKGAV
jgi:phosphoribosylanthranilate isomerase